LVDAQCAGAAVCTGDHNCRLVCTSNANCPEPGRPFCDLGSGPSVECTTKTDCAAADPLSADELQALPEHERGHVWIVTHHPYPQTVLRGNRVALRTARGVLRHACRAVAQLRARVTQTR